MTMYVGLLRAVNVGGTGLLAMKDLVRLCEHLGFARVRTYIQSGNVVFGAEASESEVRAGLAEALQVHMGKPVDVMVRNAAEMRAALAANPFAGEEPSRVAVYFLAEPPPPEPLRGLMGPAGEQVYAMGREVFVYYPEGMGRSKLKVPLAGAATTVRNMKTVAKLVELAEE